MKKSPRDRRLLADAQSLSQLRDESTIFDFSATGNPPHSYRLYFKGMGVMLNRSGQIVPTDRHEVIVELGAAYPRLVPNLAWQTPIFHPNISHNGVVCLGGYGTHWVPSLTLSEMCIMLWDMIRFANFDTESPYNREAAMWARMQPIGTFPLDNRSLKDRIIERVINIDDEEIIETGIEIVTDGLKSNQVQPDILFID
jgi:ubiquitin-protein ligase